MTAGATPFRLEGSDLARPANEFLDHLAALGRSAYTIRSYALGLAHFLSWVEGAGFSLRAMTRHQIGLYVRHFAHGGGARREGRTKKARTVNHRLSLLSSFFAYLIEQGSDAAGSAWSEAGNPVPGAREPAQRRRGAPGRDAPPRGRRAEFRRRAPRRLPERLKPAEVERLIAAARSWRDKAILTLLYRTGQRIGDWSHAGDRHGVLGLALGDIDARSRSVVVRLKGARDQHRVPVADDFWPLYESYLRIERKGAQHEQAVWIGFRRARGQPLSYSAFEASLRYAAEKAGLRVHAHMLRHTMAQMVLESTGNLKVAQELLGHAHVSTTADIYMHLDEEALVRAVADVAARTAAAESGELPESPGTRYAFPYDDLTLAELDRLADGPTATCPTEKRRS